MVYLAINKDGSEVVSNTPIRRFKDYWVDEFFKQEFDTIDVVFLPKGSIEKLIGRKLTWENEPVELTEKNLITESFNDKLISIRRKGLEYYKERCEESPQIEGHFDIRGEILTAFYQGAVEAYTS